MFALSAFLAPALFAAIGCVDVPAPDAPVQSASVYDASKRFDISPYDLQDRTARGRRGGPRGKAAHDLVEALYDWSRGKGGSGSLSSRPDDFTPSLYEPMMECVRISCEEPPPWTLFTWIQEGTVRYLVGGAQVRGGLGDRPGVVVHRLTRDPGELQKRVPPEVVERAVARRQHRRALRVRATRRQDLPEGDQRARPLGYHWALPGVVRREHLSDTKLAGASG